jgi:hypothetical protein
MPTVLNFSQIRPLTVLEQKQSDGCSAHGA